MTILKDKTHDVLRRRAKSLDADGYDYQFIGVLLRAADELEVFTRLNHGADEQLTIDAIADNRRLRNAIFVAVATLKGSQVPTRKEDAAAKVLIGALKAAPPIGEKRAILSIQIGTEETAAEVISRSYEAILQYFASRGGAHGNDNKEGEQAESSGAGRDTDQRAGAEAEGRAPGEAEASIGASHHAADETGDGARSAGVGVVQETEVMGAALKD